MTKKKSLGSSPIGLPTNNGTMGFIPDLGVSEQSNGGDVEITAVSNGMYQSEDTTVDKADQSPKRETKKKIVSYYLEIDLIDAVKSLADRKNMYYSTLVSRALKRWITENG